MVWIILTTSGGSGASPDAQKPSERGAVALVDRAVRRADGPSKSRNIPLVDQKANNVKTRDCGSTAWKLGGWSALLAEAVVPRATRLDQ